MQTNLAKVAPTLRPPLTLQGKGKALHPQWNNNQDIPPVIHALLYVQEVVTQPKILNRTILYNLVHVT